MIRTLINKLDRIFSEWIRLSKSDNNGVCTCISCGKKVFWRNIDNGHYIKRQFMAARFNELNCWPQCKICNWILQGNDVNYRKNLVAKIGESKVLELEASRRNTVKYTKFEIEILIKHYSNEVKKLRRGKGL